MTPPNVSLVFVMVSPPPLTAGAPSYSLSGMQGYPRHRLPETLALVTVLSCLFACAGQTDSPGRQPDSDYACGFADPPPDILASGQCQDRGERRVHLGCAANHAPRADAPGEDRAERFPAASTPRGDAASNEPGPGCLDTAGDGLRPRFLKLISPPLRFLPLHR